MNKVYAMAQRILVLIVLLFQILALEALSISSPIQLVNFKFVNNQFECSVKVIYSTAVQIEFQVSNLAYRKSVTAVYYENNDNRQSIDCTYSYSETSSLEIWKCLKFNLPNGIKRFYLRYQVNGNVYHDKGPNGDGYFVDSKPTPNPVDPVKPPTMPHRY